MYTNYKVDCINSKKAFWGFNGLCRWRKSLADAILEQNRFELIRYACVHYCVVSEALQLSVQPLRVCAPNDLADFVATGRGPVTEQMKVIQHILCIRWCGAIYEGIPKTSPTLKVHGQIEEVYGQAKALSIKQIHQHVA